MRFYSSFTLLILQHKCIMFLCVHALGRVSIQIVIWATSKCIVLHRQQTSLLLRCILWKITIHCAFHSYQNELRYKITKRCSYVCVSVRFEFGSRNKQKDNLFVIQKYLHVIFRQQMWQVYCFVYNKVLCCAINCLWCCRYLLLCCAVLNSTNAVYRSLLNQRIIIITIGCWSCMQELNVR